MENETRAITLTLLIKNNCIKNIIFDINETDMPNDSKTLEKLAFTLLKALKADKDDLRVQDLLNELGIERS